MQDLKILTLEDNELSGEVPIDVCLGRFDGILTTLSTDCNSEQVDCSAFFLDCCTCCGRGPCGT